LCIIFPRFFGSVNHWRSIPFELNSSLASQDVWSRGKAFAGCIHWVCICACTYSCSCISCGVPCGPCPVSRRRAQPIHTGKLQGSTRLFGALKPVVLLAPRLLRIGSEIPSGMQSGGDASKASISRRQRLPEKGQASSVPLLSSIGCFDFWSGGCFPNLSLATLQVILHLTICHCHCVFMLSPL
jgi:hypothetical protein